MTIREDVQEIRSGCAVLLRPDVRTLEVTGPDRVRFLNGMVTNDVAKLAPGQGQVAVKTSNKGRVEGLLRVRASEHALSLDLSSAVADRVRRTLEQFIIMDDCSVQDVSTSRDVISVLGPGAARAVGVDALEPHAFVRLGDRTIIRDAMLGLEGFEVHVPSGRGEAELRALEAAGARPVSMESLDAARIEAGAPIDGRDLDEDTIPMEARLERALSFDKGCYVGQEVIARATNLGGVKHMLVGFSFAGPTVPPAGARVEVAPGDGGIGELTSTVDSPTLGRPIALGYVRRAHEAVGTRIVAVAEDGARFEGAIVALPFVSG